MNIIHNTFNLRDTGEREYRVVYILACYRYDLHDHTFLNKKEMIGPIELA
jgi:hypothetical protein